VDLHMPGLDGFATADALRALRPDLKVIATSGLNPDRAALEKSGLGDDAFVMKPFTASSLLRALHRRLHGEMSEPRPSGSGQVEAAP
jgi:CheY-like chemotaxis protein